MIVSVASACTGIVLHAADGSVVPARTLEFSFDLHSDILLVPAGSTITNLLMDDKNTGSSYIAKYGFAGANALGKAIVIDGINEKGLYFGAFYFNPLAKFEELTRKNRHKAISSEELGNYILSQFASVAEVKKALPDLVIVGTWIKEINDYAPLHYAVTDSSGESIVIEITKDGLEIFNNSVNVVTNNPSYDWHLTNLNNYVGLTDKNRGEQRLGGEMLHSLGQGTGLYGLPGDHSSTSRFVRAAAFTNSALPPKTADDAIFSAFHILNSFDIPRGSVREIVAGNVFTEYTVWTSAADTKNRVYYYKTYVAQKVEKIDLALALKALKQPKIIKMNSTFSAIDRSTD
jgi:choloylglycine hydrolase